MKQRPLVLLFWIGLLASIFPTTSSADLNDFLNWPHQHVYRTFEEFYSLYNQGLYDDTEAVMTRIRYLHWALRSPFNHPVDCLADINNELEYQHYKNLMYMHVSLQLTKEYIRFANRFDKEVIFWYDHHYMDELMRGYQIAYECYINARFYWHKTKQYAKLCYQSRDMYLNGPEMDAIQDEVHKIITVEQYTQLNRRNINIHHRNTYLDYRYDDIIQERLDALEEKKAELENYRTNN